MAGLISKFSYQKLKQEVIFEDEDHHDHHLEKIKTNTERLYDLIKRTSSVRLSRRSNWVRKIKIKRKFRVKIAGFRRFFRIRRIKFANSSLTWAKVLMRFKESQSHFGDLFAGNYLFMQVTPGSIKKNTNLVANHNYNNSFNHNKVGFNNNNNPCFNNYALGKVAYY
ncbi:unnamed protein product [Amaranthus hypochondriacus]